MTEKNKVLFFYNPWSGNGMFKSNLDKILKRFQDEGYLLLPVRAAGPEVLDRVLSRINPEEYRQFIIAGGDGTINICTNAMFRNNVNIPIAIFPAGTANDFASYFDIPLDLDGMIDVALNEYTIPADVGVVNGKNFINVAALGNMVDVSQKTDPNLKNVIGRFAYYLKGATEIPELHGIKVKLTTPEQVIEEEMFFMIVMNGTSAGGFRHVSPDSEINDGLLNVILFRHMPLPQFLPLAIKAMKGEHINDSNVLSFKTSKLRIESPEDVPTDIDGEYGQKLPLDFKVRHNELTVYVPKSEWEYYERFKNSNNG